MSDSGRVPVKLSGVVIGSAVVNANGTIDLEIGESNKLGMLLLDQIQTGVIGHLSIVPMPREIDNSPYHVLYRNGGVQ